MSHWDSAVQQVVRWPPQPIEGHPNWVRLDCGCCAGIQWGGESPRTCDRCGGDGMIAMHKPSGVLAHYPGGPLCGKRDPAPNWATPGKEKAPE